jgi:hypothetical protein
MGVLNKSIWNKLLKAYNWMMEETAGSSTIESSLAN